MPVRTSILIDFSTSMAPISSTKKVTLVPINLHDPSEFDQLEHQRKLCGWSFGRSMIEGWRDSMDTKAKSFFWIIKSSADDPESKVRAGHISIESEVQPPHPELARPDKSILSISTLFVLREYRGGGIANAAMDIIESYCRTEPWGSPNCKAVTINTVARKYSEDDEGRAIIHKLGIETQPKGASNEDWYARRGYVKFDEEDRYRIPTADGEVVIVAVYMRKTF
jgi:hypothetical protein